MTERSLLSLIFMSHDIYNKMALGMLNNESLLRKKIDIDDGLLMRIADHYIFVRDCEKEIENLKYQIEILTHEMVEKSFIPISLTEQIGDLFVEQSHLLDNRLGDIHLKILKDNYSRLPEDIKYWLDKNKSDEN